MDSVVKKRVVVGVPAVHIISLSSVNLCILKYSFSLGNKQKAMKMA